MHTTLAVIALLAAGATLPQLAAAKDQANQAFAALDRNSDRFLSTEETAAGKVAAAVSGVQKVQNDLKVK